MPEISILVSHLLNLAVLQWKVSKSAKMQFLIVYHLTFYICFLS